MSSYKEAIDDTRNLLVPHIHRRINLNYSQEAIKRDICTYSAVVNAQAEHLEQESRSLHQFAQISLAVLKSKTA